jgi:membrane-bound inhibitor of C-type lysozyme
VHRVGSRKHDSHASELKPRTGVKTLDFDCQGFELVVRTGPGEVALYLPGRNAVLPQVRAASGVKYEREGLLLWMKGNEALFEMDGVRYTGCQHAPIPEVTSVIYAALQRVS